MTHACEALANGYAAGESFLSATSPAPAQQKGKGILTAANRRESPRAHVPQVVSTTGRVALGTRTAGLYSLPWERKEAMLLVIGLLACSGCLFPRY